MPELPEVENVRLSLMKRVLDRKVQRVAIHRRDIVQGRCSASALGAGQTIERIDRLGKQLVLVFGKRCVCVHLGMTGSLRCGGQEKTDHVHVTWHLAGAGGDGHMRFRDPRRFGGVWTFASRDELQRERWDKLGEDALTITPTSLQRKLAATRRAIKASLLDQHVIAGLGNIYVDELLFEMKVHPMTRACDLKTITIRRLVRAMRRLLNQAISVGGSTVSDYVDGEGREGHFQDQHQVYGRSGLNCKRCGDTLMHMSITGRSTVFCNQCQSKGGVH